MDTAPSRRDDLNPFDIAILGQTRIDDFRWIEVGPFGRNQKPFFHGDDQVGLSIRPLLQVVKFQRRWGIGGVTTRHTTVDPGRNGVDLVIAQ